MKLFLAKHLQEREEFSADIKKAIDSIQVENMACIKPWKGLFIIQAHGQQR